VQSFSSIYAIRSLVEEFSTKKKNNNNNSIDTHRKTHMCHIERMHPTKSITEQFHRTVTQKQYV